MDAAKLIKTALPSLIPDVDIAIFNTGLWTGGFPAPAIIQPVMKDLFEFTQSGSKKGVGKCFWKGLSPSWRVGHLSGYPDAFGAMDQPFRRLAYQAGCGVFDVSHVTKSFASFSWEGDVGRASCCGEKEMRMVYFDAAHFQPWVNEELNNILLNVLC